MKSAVLVTAFVGLIGLGLTYSAEAANSVTKSYKVSVTLPSPIGEITNDSLVKGKVLAEISPLMNLEYTVIVRNNEKILMKTIVVN